MMEDFDHMHCGECGVALSLKEIFESKDKCPSCGKKTSWISDPIFMGFDEEDELNN